VQIDEDGFAWADSYQKTGNIAFVTSQTYSGGISGEGGLSQADGQCQSLATTAGLSNPGNFVAFLSDDTDDAFCRILGLSGKIADNCGLVGDLPASPQWVRPDNVLVIADLHALSANNYQILAPITIDEQNGWSANLVWTGTNYDGTVETDQHCNNWTSSTDAYIGRNGVAVDIGNRWMDNSGFNCDSTRAFYCFETD
jgi:hypothetical protein